MHGMGNRSYVQRWSVDLTRATFQLRSWDVMRSISLNPNIDRLFVVGWFSISAAIHKAPGARKNQVIGRI